MSLIRVLVSAPATLTHVFTVDEAPTDAAGTVTVDVNRLDGTDVSSGNASHGDTGVYTYTLPAQADLDTVTVDWTGTFSGSPVTVRDYVEIAGGYLFGLAQARSAPPALSVNDYPTALLASKRIVVEQECERICRRAFVPRFTRVALSGTGTPYLGVPELLRPARSVRAVSVGGVAWSPAEVAAVGISGNTFVRPGGAIWPAGAGNIIFEYEYGDDYAPVEIADAGILRLRSQLTPTNSKVPYNALSFTAQDGGTYRLSTPNRERTGIPAVDAVYEGYGRKRGPVIA